MINLTVVLRSGELKHNFTGHSYNGHVLRHNTNKTITVGDEPAATEIEMLCMMCGEEHTAQIRTTEGYHTDLLHLYLCGQFEASCPVQKKDVTAAAKSAWEKHKGNALTDEVRRDMRQTIQNACDKRVAVNFE